MIRAAFLIAIGVTLSFSVQAQLFGEPWDHMIESVCQSDTQASIFNCTTYKPLQFSDSRTWYRTARNNATTPWPVAHANTWTFQNYTSGASMVSSSWLGASSFPYWANAFPNGGDLMQSYQPNGVPNCGYPDPNCIVTISSTELYGASKYGNFVQPFNCPVVAGLPGDHPGVGGVVLWETADLPVHHGTYGGIGDWAGHTYPASWTPAPQNCSPTSSIRFYVRYQEQDNGQFPMWYVYQGVTHGPIMLGGNLIISEVYVCGDGCPPTEDPETIMLNSQHMERFIFASQVTGAGPSVATLGKMWWGQWNPTTTGQQNVAADCSQIQVNGYFSPLAGNGNPNLVWDTCWDWTEYHMYDESNPANQFSGYWDVWPFQN